MNMKFSIFFWTWGA